MAKVVAIVGPSGSGKSTSAKYLNPETSYIINTAGKELPFKGSEKLYNSENKNHYVPSSAVDALNKLKVISEKAIHVKDVILEDSNYFMSFNLINKASEVGFTKFSIMAKDMLALIQESKKLRDDLIIYYFTHSEEIKDGEDIVGHKIKTSGKAIDSQIVMEGLFTVVLYTLVETKGDKAEFKFVTNRLGTIPAKSPMEMFTDLKIDNNLQLVSDTIREYYS
jgi:ABC-type dipeptide/oligopeptide/nickel transport system ATPase component